MLASRKQRAVAARDSEKGVVYIYQYPIPKTWNGCQNPSPFCVKLEAYLNFAKIPYKSIPTLDGHPQTGKMPYIRYNGVCIPDSNICIEYLNQQFGIDLDSHLSPSERAISRSMSAMTRFILLADVVLSMGTSSC